MSASATQGGYNQSSQSGIAIHSPPTNLAMPTPYCFRKCTAVMAFVHSLRAGAQPTLDSRA